MTSNDAKCQFWLTNNAGTDKLRLPVLPEKIQISHSAGNESVSVSGLGEITILQDRKQIGFEFACHFPAVYHQGCNYKEILKPDEYKNKIVGWMEIKSPVKFIVTGSDIDLYCSIESFVYYEQGGDPDTLYYTIKLKEFREPKIRTIDTTPIVTPPTSPDTPIGEYTRGRVKNNGKRLPLRKKKSSSSAVLARIPNKTEIDIIEKSGAWYKCVYKEKTGFCNAKKIKILE